MSKKKVAEKLYDSFCEVPIIDIHSHLQPNNLDKNKIENLIFYHMLKYPLRSTGITEKEIWVGHERLEEKPFWREISPVFTNQFESGLQNMRTQGFGWLLEQLMEKLYNVKGPLTVSKLPELTETFNAKYAEGGWGHNILKQGKIEIVLASNLHDDEMPEQYAPIYRPTTETSLMNGTHDYNPWEKRFNWWMRHNPERKFKRKNPLEIEITGIESLRAATKVYFSDLINWEGRQTFVEWVSSLADFRPLTDDRADSLIKRAIAGEVLTAEDNGLLEGLLIRETTKITSQHATVIQLCYGTQYVTGQIAHPFAKASQSFTGTFGYLLAEFPDTHFNMLGSYAPDEQALCSLSTAYNNLSLGGFWYQNFFATNMEQGWNMRLDMMPLDRICGFFSDGYCAEWIYGRALMTRRVMANALADRIERGFCDEEYAMYIAITTLYDTPKKLMAIDSSYMPRPAISAE
jgi:glucuronate isomerase